MCTNHHLTSGFDNHTSNLHVPFNCLNVSLKKKQKKGRWPIMTKEELRIFRNIICMLQ
jgi:hypothetical protein